MRSNIANRYLYAAMSGVLSLSLLGIVAGVNPAFADPQIHHQIADDSAVRRSVAQYTLPHVTLVRDDGKSVDLAAELDDGRPVVVNFVYTSCTTICPMSSQVFEQFQDDLGDARDSVHLVSISIDPEQDTPARLRAYAAQFHAAKGWNHYSGTMAASIAVQRVFDAYRGDKMSHVPLTLVRAAPDKPWVRFDGFARADDLMAERRSWADSAGSLVAR
jgi:protein SCO1/2